MAKLLAACKALRSVIENLPGDTELPFELALALCDAMTESKAAIAEVEAASQ